MIRRLRLLPSYATFLRHQDLVIVFAGARGSGAGGDSRTIDDRESAGRLDRTAGCRIEHFTPESSSGELPIFEDIGNCGNGIAEHLSLQRGLEEFLFCQRREERTDWLLETIDVLLGQRCDGERRPVDRL